MAKRKSKISDILKERSSSRSQRSKASSQKMIGIMMGGDGGMMEQMDKDGDGLCDYCGMSVEMCRKMMSS